MFLPAVLLLVTACGDEDPASESLSARSTTTTTVSSATSTVSSTTTTTLPSSDRDKDALLIVGDSEALTSGDAKAKGILEGLGYDVTVDSHEEPVRPSGFALVMMGESSSSSALGTKYKDSPMPVVILENGVWDEHNYISGAAGTLSQQTRLDIAEDIHEVSGGHTGSGVTVLHTAADFKSASDGALPSSAEVVLSAAGLNDGIGIVFESGATLHNGDMTESRRVLLGFTDSAVANLNPNGQWILEQAIRWVTQQDVGADLDDGRRILFVHGSSEPMSGDDETMVDRMRDTLGYRVTSRQAADVSTGDAAGFDLVAISKTVESTDVADKFKGFEGGVWLYEDNAQAISVGGVSMMALIDVTDPDSPAWHSGTMSWYIEPTAPTGLTGGLSGLVTIYDSSQQSTYAPVGMLPAGAIRVGEFNGDGDGRFSYYAYESGAGLADTTAVAGRRVYFGLYDSGGATTFEHLTADGLILFDASLDWASSAGGQSASSLTSPH